MLADLEDRVRAAEDELFKDIPTDARAAFQAHALKLAMSIHATDPSIDPCIAVMDVIAQGPAPSGTR